jgi:peptidoglycan LD-endopeptidase LytH
MITLVEKILAKNTANFHPVVAFNSGREKLFPIDFTQNNEELKRVDIKTTETLASYINYQLTTHNAKYGIGGYNENRVLYQRSSHFAGAEARTIHLGIDIWGPAGTKVYVPLGGVVHSFAYNNNFGDYGATIILQHQLETTVFHTLYGHLSLADIAHLQEGKYIGRGEPLAHFGGPKENGDWPPHLHFQIITDMELKQGDYPGVCTVTESEKYLANCPNPDLILDMMKYANL